MTEKKTKEIIEITEDFLPKKLVSHLEEIKKNFAEDPMIYAKGFLDSLKEVFAQARRLQEEGKKGKTAFISFSFLYSSLLLGKNGFRIDVYDKDFYLDEQETCTFWEPAEIFRYVEDDVKCAERRLDSSFVPIDSNERIELYNSYLVNYYQITAVLLKDLVKLIESMKAFKEMQNEKVVMVTMGEFMDKFQCMHKIITEDE